MYVASQLIDIWQPEQVLLCLLSMSLPEGGAMTAGVGQGLQPQ